MYGQAKRIRPIRVFTTNVRCFYDTFLVKIATNRGLTSNIFYCIILALLYSSKSTSLNIIYSNFYGVFIEKKARTMKPRIFLGFCIGLLLVGFGCRNSNPVAPIKEQPPTLTVEESNCTEVWLKNSSSGANYITLKRDITVLSTIHRYA